MFVVPSDVSIRALQLVTQLAVAGRPRPGTGSAHSDRGSRYDAQLEFDAIADASDIPVVEIAAIAAERIAAHHEILGEGLAERARGCGSSLRARLAPSHRP